MNMPAFLTRQPRAPRRPSKCRPVNRYGVDADYFARKLSLVLRDLADFKPDELARALARLSRTADAAVLAEPEFSRPGKEPARYE